MSQIMRINIKGCARCEKNHDGVELTALNRPMLYNGMPIATHFGTCPSTQEPIMTMVVVTSTGKPK
jgi:hypothetical protein